MRCWERERREERREETEEDWKEDTYLGFAAA